MSKTIDHIWIDEPHALAEFCRTVADGEIVAIDTESDHFFAYRPYVALIQIATTDRAALVDPLALSSDALDDLLAIVEEPGITKIMHSAPNDIGELDRDFGIDAQNVFDTQLAARFLGYERFSLDALLTETAGIKLDKKYQRFDWARRPIPAPAREYAIRDVVHLFDLRERFLDDLHTRGWLPMFEEHSAHMVANSRYQPTEFDPERWRKIKGSADLDGKHRAVFAALYQYRHELCDRIDRAPLHVFENGAMLRVAQQLPRTLEQLGAIRGLNRRTAERNGQEILDVIRRAIDAPVPPARAPRSGDGRRPTTGERARLKALLELRQQLAADAGLPVDFVASRGALEAIAATCPQTVDELADVELLRWQREMFGAALLDACARTG